MNINTDSKDIILEEFRGYDIRKDDQFPEVLAKLVEGTAYKLTYIPEALAKSAIYSTALSFGGPPIYFINPELFKKILNKQKASSQQTSQIIKKIFYPIAIDPGVPKKVEPTTLKHRVGVYLDTHANVIAKVTQLFLSTWYAVSVAEEGDLDSALLLKNLMTQGLIEFGWMKICGASRVSALTVSNIFRLNLSMEEHLKWLAAGTAVEWLSREGIRFIAGQLISSQDLESG